MKITVEPSPSPAPGYEDEPLYLVLMWHHHQPFYLKDQGQNSYREPWVRLHAARDYVDLAALLLEYPDIRASFNLTAPLLKQLQDFSNGARDLYWQHTIVAAEELTEQQKQFIRTHFFDNRSEVIAQFPRYQELFEQREHSESWDSQAWRDLQVLFNLSWIDPELRQEGPLAALVEKEHGYGEQDKAVVLEEYLRLLSEVIPLHQRLQEQGQIELLAGPLYHPILPLLIDSDIAREPDSSIDLPPQYQYPEDATAQVKQGVQYYRSLFGGKPAGLWPPEGAISEAIIEPIAQSGIRWMAADEAMLAQALGREGFDRESSELVVEPERLYRPYRVQSPGGEALYLFFRDRILGKKFGSTYPEMSGEAASQDFIARLMAIRRQLRDRDARGPFVVTVVVDGWENWASDADGGKTFLRFLYKKLEEEQEKGTIRTITPAEFVEHHTSQPPLERLPVGSWRKRDLRSWIGNEAQNRAWTFLGQARAFIRSAGESLDEEVRAAALEKLYSAESSDWFRSFSEHPDRHNERYDHHFRQTLKQVYELAGAEAPPALDLPLRPPRPVAPSTRATGTVSPTIDGLGEEAEWKGSGQFRIKAKEETSFPLTVKTLWYGFGESHLYFRLEAQKPWVEESVELRRVGLYLPGGEGQQFFGRLQAIDQPLGFGAGIVAEVTIQENRTSAMLYRVNREGRYVRKGPLPVAADQGTLELAVPFEALGHTNHKRPLRVRLLLSEGDNGPVQRLPAEAPGEMAPPR